MVAVNQKGSHGNNRYSYGHSVVYDPWGEMILNSEDSEGVFTCELQRSRLDFTRNKINTWSHRKVTL